MRLPGNPHSLIKDGFCTAVIAMQDYDVKTIEKTLSSQDYDMVINCNELGYEIFIGQTYFTEEDVWAFPPPSKTWKLNREFRTWSPPIPYPLDGKEYIWSEKNQTWVGCSSNEFYVDNDLTYSTNFIDINESNDLIGSLNSYSQIDTMEDKNAN